MIISPQAAPFGGDQRMKVKPALDFDSRINDFVQAKLPAAFSR